MSRPVLARFAAIAGAVAALAAPATANAAPALVKVGDFTVPVYVTAPPADERLFVVERAGTVRVVEDGATLAEPFLDVTRFTSLDGERGLLSIAFAPDYADSGLLYVFLTRGASPIPEHPEIAEGDLMVLEFRRSSDNPNRADPDSRRVVLSVPHPGSSFHNGGQLQFGPDQLLYISTGDGGGGGVLDPANNAQRLDTLLGKLLRIDPRAAEGAPYRIPQDNPFTGTAGARPEIFAYGLRNPWRFSFDRVTGDLTIGDVGHSAREEIDFARRADGGGVRANFGWRCYEGSLRTSVPEPCQSADHVLPVFEYAHPEGQPRAVTGGYVVRDPGVPSLFGRYIYADFFLACIDSLGVAAPGADHQSTVIGASRIVSFGEDASGRVYVVSFRGPVYRITEGDPTPCRRPDTQITAGPSGTVGDTSARFEFTATPPEGATFECRLDDAAVWVSCTSPHDVKGLADGPHSLQVRAKNAVGVDPTPASRSWTVDTVAPTTVIDRAPLVHSNDPSPTFEFSADEGGAGFQCRVDGGGWVTCTSPHDVAGPLADGDHTFEVRASDAAGNTSAGAIHSWTIDTVAPKTVIDRAPLVHSNDPSPTFEFSADEGGVGFDCRVDGGGWVACTSPHEVAGPLADGDHMFEVRASDAAGNTSAGAIHNWTIDTVAPEASIVSAPPEVSTSRTAAFAFGAQGAEQFECRLDGGIWERCSSPRVYEELAAGLHVFDVVAIDAAGNRDGTPARHTWTVAPSPAPELAAAILARRTIGLGTLLKRGLEVRVRCTMPCTVQLQLVVSRALVRRHGLRSRTVGRRRVVVTGQETVREIVRLDRSAARRLVGARGFRLRVRIAASPTVGGTADRSTIAVRVRPRT
jgi:hypothetical protein